MKKQFNKKFATFMTIALAFVIGMGSAQEASAQRYLSEAKDSSDVKGIGQFAENLSQFLTLAEKAEGETSANPLLLRQLEVAGKKVKDGTSNLRTNLKGLVGLFKTRNQWNDDLDSQFTQLLGSRKVKGFFQNNGARKILTDADAAINVVNTNINEIIANVSKLKGASSLGNSIFSQSAFAPSASARKVRFKCVLLGVAIFGAELLKAPKTAENLDGYFDKSCGAGANTAT